MIATATADNIKRLREETSCGVIDCKKALEEAGGDFNKAKDLLRKRGLEMAAKKSDRVAKEGRVEVYIHNGNGEAFFSLKSATVDCANAYTIGVLCLKVKCIDRAQFVTGNGKGPVVTIPSASNQ